MIDINYTLNKLIKYGLNNNLITEDDIYFTANRLLNLLNLDDFKLIDVSCDNEIQKILNDILDYAYKNKILEENGIVFRDLFDTEVMNCLMPRPNEVNRLFWEHYKINKKESTNYFYDLSIKSNYIRKERVLKNIVWKTKTNYGDIDITINLSKPEKDPVAIALAKLTPKLSYPKCLLCKENEGFKGNLNHPARSNHRIIKLSLKNEIWYLQYSPYVYYNEHCIVFKSQHEPMKISKDTFKRLLSFVELFPHYFIGSNADLPIVGGSILNHDHFQGGNYEFPMTKAKCKYNFKFKEFHNVEAGIVDWPMSVIRLISDNINDLVNLADIILNKWRNYSDNSQGIIAYSNNEPHNTITPIARFRNNKYELNLVLRNNQTNEECKLGIFHPHEEHHHIKKENIGLIEVMGLAVLPARLDEEMSILKKYLVNGMDIMSDDDIKKHYSWAIYIINKYNDINTDNVDKIIKDEIGYKFVEILEQCGVFKNDEIGQDAFKKFINNI